MLSYAMSGMMRSLKKWVKLLLN